MINGRYSSQLNRMALDALPVDDDEWGSERQTEADNAFCQYVEELIELDDEYFHWALKATTEERVNEMWTRVHDASGLCRGGPECECAAECAFCGVTHLSISHDPVCGECDRTDGGLKFGPNHNAMPGCESGGYPHCTCDSCF